MTPRPIVGSVTEELYEALAPFAYADESLGWPLLLYCEAIGGMSQEINDLVRDTDDSIGWSILFNPDLVPAKFLPWLAQFVGVRFPGGLTEAEQREYIKEADGFNRGKVSSIVAAVKRTLTGTQSILIRERFDPSNPTLDKAYHLQIITRTAETPDPTLTNLVAQGQKPIGMIFHVSQLAGQDYLQLSQDYASYAAVAADYTTYQDVADDTP